MTTFPLWAWYGFTALIAALMVLDLVVLGLRTRDVSFRSAAIQSVFWIVVAFLFGAVLFVFAGAERGSEYFTGYIVERSLSVDNVFVFALIFTYFAVPSQYQNRVLFWGILGALILRGGFIAVGAELLHRYEWMVYVFGIFLIYTGIRMAMHDDAEVHPERNPVLRLVRKLVPMTKDFHEENFFVRHGGKLLATPLFAVIVVVGTTDVVFAVDSIPAIFAVTSSTFIVWSANAFAILGLRPLYFMLAGMIDRFVYLSIGLSIVLVFVGAKFIYSGLFGKFPIWISLTVIATVVTASILASLWKTRSKDDEDGSQL